MVDVLFTAVHLSSTIMNGIGTQVFGVSYCSYFVTPCSCLYYTAGHILPLLALFSLSIKGTRPHPGSPSFSVPQNLSRKQNALFLHDAQRVGHMLRELFCATNRADR
jgi:hypothetical protein